VEGALSTLSQEAISSGHLILIVYCNRKLTTELLVSCGIL
jgi:hypothetical protein